MQTAEIADKKAEKRRKKRFFRLIFPKTDVLFMKYRSARKQPGARTTLEHSFPEFDT